LVLSIWSGVKIFDGSVASAERIITFPDTLIAFPEDLDPCERFVRGFINIKVIIIIEGYYLFAAGASETI
jgi:hypothetical protein